MHYCIIDIIVIILLQDGKTLLHCAGESGEVEMLEFWIKKGDYDVNVKDEVISFLIIRSIFHCMLYYRKIKLHCLVLLADLKVVLKLLIFY